MNNFNINQKVEDYINFQNQKLSESAAIFFNNLDELKIFLSDEDCYRLNEELLSLDAHYQKILDFYRPALRKYTERHIRTILATTKQGDKYAK